MVKFLDEQSEVDRLRALNAELVSALEGVRRIEHIWCVKDGDTALQSMRATVRNALAIAKATNQEAGR